MNSCHSVGRRCAILLGLLLVAVPARGEPPARELFARDNLIAWCIVPFDSAKRSPEERAAMLRRLGFKHFAYDWRAEHVPTFDAEIAALKQQGVALDAFWVAPGELNRESQIILDALKRNGVKAQLWALIDLGADTATGEEQRRRVRTAVEKLGPLAEEAGKIGCDVGLYNHGGWFGEPENQIEIIEALKAKGITNVGMVYNLHHGHDHLDRFAKLLPKMKPYLFALNLNGMDPGGDKVGRKILPLGQGSLDLSLLKTIRDSGYRGPIGILGHTQDDAEARLKDNLDGLDWLVPQLDGQPAGPKPAPRTPVPPKPTEAKGVAAVPFDEAPARIAALADEAAKAGDAARGLLVFADPRNGCVACHKVGQTGGAAGPELTDVGRRLVPEKVVESLLWPSREVKPEFVTVVAAVADGRMVQGYRHADTDAELVLKDPNTGELIRLPKDQVEAVREQGTLMPDGIVAALSAEQRRDLVRFLTSLGHGPTPALPDLAFAHGHAPASFPYSRAPLRPGDWPGWKLPVNRDRIYDFYAKEAEYFRLQKTLPPLLPAFPGLDGGTLGHWGNQNEEVWADGRWNQTDLGNVLSGVFRSGSLVVPKAVCVRLGDRGEISACFNPETLRYEAVWSGGFVKFSAVRHGFMDGLRPDGPLLPSPTADDAKPGQPFKYKGFYRQGPRVIFAYSKGNVDYLDAPWVDSEGHFTHEAAPASQQDRARLTRGGGPERWPQVIAGKVKRGHGTPYAVDTFEPPFENPWKALLFFGDHDFLPDGSAVLCTMQGDVWRVEGLDGDGTEARWRRVASGLHQALGLVVADGDPHVLGRDQITRLRDLDGDGEYDFHECVTNAYVTSPSGHDFICGLQRDAEGNFYTASGKQGLIRIHPDGQTVDVLATGLRNPNGLGLGPDGVLTAPNSEGDWVPASMACEIRVGGHYGHGGPRNGQTPDLPLLYFPRGLDNSSGAQAFVDSDRWGPLQGQWLHFSSGAGTMFLMLRDRVNGQAQGAAVPFNVEFRSGAQRGRFRARDGQLYVSGMGGWGTYTPDDGCFQRVRYTGAPVQLPIAWRAHRNGVNVTFSLPVEPSIASEAANHFVQAWNYRYGKGYGSPELSPSHPGMPGHDPWRVRSVHVSSDGLSVFLELPDLQPVNQLHLHMKVDHGPAHDLYATVHALDEPFTGFPGYRPSEKVVAAHPILADLALSKHVVPNPWRTPIANARAVVVEAGKNLSYSVKSFTARRGETIRFTFENPDVVPHNWVLVRPGKLQAVGEAANRIIADPEAVARHYVPMSDDVLAYTDMVYPGEKFEIFFQAPDQPGRYPYLCSFPGHWMVMNGEMIVE